MSAYDKFQNSNQYQLESGAEEGAISSDDTKRIASSMQKKKTEMSAKGESGTQGVGNMMMSSGDPTTMAAGATLKVISSAAERRRAERVDAANRETDRRSKLISALGNLGQGVGSTGMA